METIHLQTIKDARGSITVAEKLPFAIQRVYYLHDCGADRGGHAQRTLERVMVATSGSFIVRWRGSREWGTEMLNDPTVALHIPPMTWLELSDFTAGAVCLVMASAEYDEGDSIRDFSEFLREARAS